MSQADFSPAEAALVVSLFDSMRLANFCGIAATTLLFYDYVLTFSREVRCIWSRKFTGATVLFLLNRYLFLVYRVLMTVEAFPLGHNSQAGQMICTGILRTTQVLTTATTLVTALFTALRMYAIWSKNRIIFGVVLLIGVVPIAVNMFYFTKVTFVTAPSPLAGCADEVTLTVSESDILGMFNCGFAILSDLIVLILTGIKTIEIKRTSPARQSSVIDSFDLTVQNQLLSYTTLIQRDGTIYFLVLLSLNIVNLIAIKYQAFGALPALTEVLTSILVSRFLLDLRSIYLAGADPESNKSETSIDQQMSASLVFAAGNLGAPLEDIMSESEQRYVRVTTDEVAYISEDPLVMGLHASRREEEGEGEDVEERIKGLRPLKELYDEPV